MSWRMDSTAGAAIWDTEPMTTADLACRDEELAWLMRHEGMRWRVINGRIAQKGDPVNAEGTYGALLAYPLAQNLAAVTGGTANVAWWNPLVYTPIPNNSILAPDAYRIAATGLITTVSGTVIMNPAIGATTAAGIALGASAAVTPVAATNAIWYILGDITVRTAGSAGTAFGVFDMKLGSAAGPTNTVQTMLFGNTAASGIDFTGATANLPGGLLIAATPSVSTTSVTPTQIHWMSWN